MISFEGKNGMKANDLAICIPERGHNLIEKNKQTNKKDTLFYSLSDARILCKQFCQLLPFKLVVFRV